MGIFGERLPAVVEALAGAELGPAYDAFRQDMDLTAFAREMHDSGDDPRVGIALLAACSAGFGERGDQAFEGDVSLPAGQPLLVHGDLRVAGTLAVTSQLLVTGNVQASTVADCGPDSFVAVLGDVKTRGLWTSGRFYVRGAVLADSFVWAAWSGDWLSARAVRTRAYIEEDRPSTRCDEIDAAVDIRFNYDHPYPPMLRLADVFAYDLYRPSGDVDVATAIQWLAEGRDVFASDNTQPTPLPLDVFRSWLKNSPGSQREKLAALRGAWAARLAAADPEEVEALLQRTIKSPKLRDDLEAFRDELAQMRASREGGTRP